MIDKSFQGLGYGKAALQAVLAEIRMLNQVRQISICYEPENSAAQQLYAKAGFVEDGLDEDGEMIAYLTLEG
ncbi:Acetyltransferase (GNAT) family protein [compost metagenome]